MFQKTVSWIFSNFTYHGRIARKPYIAVSLVYYAYFILLSILLKTKLHFRISDYILSLISSLPSFVESIFSVVFMLVSFSFLIFGVFIVIFTTFQTIRRLHDTNHSGWWWLFKFVSIPLFSMGTLTYRLEIPLPLGLVLDLFLFIADGTVGPNRYGNDPKHRVIACADNVCDEESENIVTDENLSN